LLYRPDQHFALEAAAGRNLSGASPVFNSLDWSEESYRMFERIGLTGDQVHICYSPMAEVRMSHKFFIVYMYIHTYIHTYIIYIYIYIYI